jgi:Tol biopolymer transport system component
MGFFWSPDSRQIAYFSDKLRKTDIQGGPPLVLSDNPGSITSSGSWGPDGRIVLGAIMMDRSLFRFSTQSNVLDRFNRISSTLSGHCYEPQFLADGHHFLFGYRSTDNKDLAVYLGSLEDDAPKRLITAGSHGYYTQPPGSSQAYIVFERNMILMAQAYDERRQEMTGEAWPISSKPLTYWRAFSASLNGVLAYRTGSPRSSLVWFNRKGERIAALPFRGDYRQFALSPDESRLAAAAMDETATNRSNIWVMDLSRGTYAKLTSYRVNDWYPTWSPDGRKLAFSSSKDGPFNIFVRTASANGIDKPMASSPSMKWVSSWSSDGKFLAYWALTSQTRGDIWLIPTTGGEPFSFLQSEHDELQPEFSPDGRWIAYTSDESERYEIYVRRFDGRPATGAALRVSIDGGTHPKWRRDSKELFFLAPDHKLMAAEIRSSPSITAAVPKALFQTHIQSANFLTGYAVAGNGQRFLMNTPAEDAESGPVTVIVNWNPQSKR